ncbi:MAG TPA: hypothetical protein VN043_16525 [Rhodanobacter sp.]|nr:hypothetical protein [Rhodanobacter sp.]
MRHRWLLRAAGALLAIGAIAAIPTRAQAGVYVSVNIAPPILPLYAQPMIPGPGYIWTPGYWAWGGDGYYWVPGTWVLPPFIGALWTPGYWGWGDGVYVFHRGYWGRHVGFYGGIDYGYGYGGHGYEGGYWRNGGFYYNRSVNHVGGNVRNVYNRTVIHNTSFGNNRRISYNGGSRGTGARATPQERGWEREQHRGPVEAQMQQRNMASRTSSLRASVNHGAPPIAATARAGAFRDHDIVAAHDAPRSATMRNDAAMRSTGFAPHGNQSMRSGNAGRYNPSMRERSYPAPAENRIAPHQSRVARGTGYQPQDVSAAHYQPQPARPMRNDARENYRPPNQRPVVAHASASRSHAAPAKHQERREHGDDRHQH